MFERLDNDAIAYLTDEALASALAAATRAEAVAAARRLALTGEITARECDDEDDETAHQVIDGWAFAKASISAACNLSPRAASTQMCIAQALRDRLPHTAALFATGAISADVIGTITWRTKLITDPEAIALVDTAIAGEATAYGTQSAKSLVDAVDLCVEKFDPAAVIRSKRAAKDLYVEFDDKDDPHGVSSFWGRLRVTDRKILDQRLDDLADTVCANDPRTRGERRSAALGALGVVGPALQRLACQCGDAECEGNGKDPRAGVVVVYVLTDKVPDVRQQAPRASSPTSETTPSREPTGPAHNNRPEPDSDAKPESEPTAPAASTVPGAGTGVLLDGGVIPAAILADLIAEGATVTPVADISDLPTERQYRPSTTLTAFVRMQAMHCSFPGCNRPAHRCDLDHVTPWPQGATHPGNLRPLCREHHLLKTFRSGADGWTPEAKSDGSTTWTAPTGHTYTKGPGAAILFPHWKIDTPIPRRRAITLLDDPDRNTMMPTRQCTRAQDREQRINAERARNTLEIALAGGGDPPPF